MKKLWMLLLLPLCLSCAQRQQQIPAAISVHSSHDIARHFLEGFPQCEDKWLLRLRVAMDYDANRHSRSQAKLLLQSYRFPDGWRIFVLQRQVAPAYTLLSFTQGIIFKSLHTHVRFLLSHGQEKAAGDYIRKVMADWKAEHPKLAAQPQRDFQQLRFFCAGKLAGRFYFILPPEPMATDKEPEKNNAVLNRVKAFYEYHQDGAPRANFHPNIFRALARALPTLTQVAVPPDSQSRRVEDSTTVAAVVATCLELLPGLAASISSPAAATFAVDYHCRSDHDGRKSLLADARQFANPNLGSGFALRRYQRRRLFAADGRMLADSLELTSGGNAGQRLYFFLSLQRQDTAN